MRLWAENETIRTRFGGRCPLCLQRKAPGQLVCPDIPHSEWAHYTCAYAVNRGRPPAPPALKKQGPPEG